MISKSTYELLTPIINTIDRSIIISSVIELVPSGIGVIGSYKLFSNNTKWATANFPIIIGANSYKIEQLSVNEYLIVSGNVLPVAGSFNLYAPKFYHGSIKVAEGELEKKINNKLLNADRMPMIWLHEPVDEKLSLQEDEAIERYSNCDLYFMVDSDFSKWSQEDHYNRAIKPMRQLIDGFINSMNISHIVNNNLIDNIEVKDLPRFGRYTAENGAKTMIFAQTEMSGTKLKIEIPFVRQASNCN